MDNPVDFLESNRWRSPECVSRLIDELTALSFSATNERYAVQALNLQGQAFSHAGVDRFAVIYEKSDLSVWCEICGSMGRGRQLIVSSSPEVTEWPQEPNQIIRAPGASARRLMEEFDAASEERPLERYEPELLGLWVHPRFFQQWSFVNQESPAERARESQRRCERLGAWVNRFVEFFQSIGYLQGAGPASEVASMILEYGDPLFENMPGVLAVVDDFDELSDFFSSDEIETLPEGNPEIDARILAVLDSDRVWWQFRLCSSEDAWEEGTPELRRSLLAKSLSRISGIPSDSLMPSIPDQPGAKPNLDCLATINHQLPVQGSRFYKIQFPAREDSVIDPVYVLFLTPGEVERLRSQRGWPG